MTTRRNPFTIRIYVPEGDPEGVRIIDRLSSTGIFFAIPRDKWHTVRSRQELRGAGIYILSGYSNPEDELPTVYVGHADTIYKRIDQHEKNKDFWDKVVTFVSPNKMNSTHAKWLEHALIKQLIEANRSLIANSNSPVEPTISESEKAEMRVFLTEIYQTLPLVGLRAFEIPQAVVNPSLSATNNDNTQDTIIVPAKEEGFREVFINKNQWYAVRIAGGKLDKLKYIAAYQVAPISAITHFAVIDRIEPYGEEGKYRLIFAERAKSFKNPIKFDLKTGAMQSPRYTSFKRLSKASKMSDLF